jgi:hypothetical protein
MLLLLLLLLFLCKNNSMPHQLQMLEGVGEDMQVMLKVAVQVTEVCKRVDKMLREVMLVVVIKEGTTREVVPKRGETITQPKWSTCSSLSGNTFLFQD